MEVGAHDLKKKRRRMNKESKDIDPKRKLNALNKIKYLNSMTVKILKKMMKKRTAAT